MNCSFCLSKCKADCCRGPIPMPKDILDRHTPIRPITHTATPDDNTVVVLHVTEDRRGVCPFLGLDDKCSIYDDRPPACRMFGNGHHIFMTCSFQSADGRIRSRQERRAIEREQANARKKTPSTLDYQETPPPHEHH